MKLVGLVGGAGAFASQKILKYALQHAVEHYQAKSDRDFPNILLHNLPFYDLGEEAQLTDISKSQLFSSVKAMEQFGCEHIFIACNTLHYYLSELKKYVNTPIFDLIDYQGHYFKEKNIQKIGVLCSQFSRDMEIHKQKFQSYGVEVVYPTEKEQQDINHIIGKLISRSQSTVDNSHMVSIRHSLLEHCDHVLLGCTELTLIHALHHPTSTDSSKLLAKVITETSLGI